MSVRAAIRVGVRNVEHAGKQSAESRALDGLGGRERKRAEGAPVKSAVKRDDLLPPGVISRELDGRLDGFGPGVSEIDFLGLAARCYRFQLSGQLDHAFIVKIRAGHVNELGCLPLNGGDDFGVAVASGNY